MASVTTRSLDDGVKTRLRVQAADVGRSMERGRGWSCARPSSARTLRAIWRPSFAPGLRPSSARTTNCSRAGRPAGEADGQVAAFARFRAMAVVTRIVRDFGSIGLEDVDPGTAA